MAYIGQPPFQDFTSTPSKDSFTGDGSTTTFDLAQEVAAAGENAVVHDADDRRAVAKTMERIMIASSMIDDSTIERD